MQLGLRPRLHARPSLVDLVNRAKSPPASPATGAKAADTQIATVATPPPLARLEEAAVQALTQPLPTSPTSTSDDKELDLDLDLDLDHSSSSASASSFNTTNSSTPQLSHHHQQVQPQQPATPTAPPSAPISSADAAQAEAAAAQRPTSPQKTVNMAPVRTPLSLTSSPSFTSFFYGCMHASHRAGALPSR